MIFRIISEWRIFKMRKKIVILFTVLFIGIGTYAIIKPIYAASNQQDGIHYQNCKSPSDCIYHENCSNKDRRNRSQESKMNLQMQSNCTKNHQHHGNNNCVSQNNQNCSSTVVTHHKRQMHHN